MEIIKRALRYGLYLIAFLLPFQTRLILARGELAGKYWEYGTISLYVIDIVLVAVLFLWAWYYLKRELTRKEDRPRIAWFWWLLSGWDLMVFVSIFMVEDHVVALYRYAIFLLGIGLAALVIYVPVERIKFVYFFVAGLVFHSLLGVGQFLAQYAPGSKYLGMAPHDPSDPGVFVVEAVGRDGVARRWLRAYGGLDHPNILGGVLAIGFIILLAVISRKYIKDKNKQALGYLLFVVLASGLFFTFSRGAGLALVVGVVVFLAVSAWQKKWPELKLSLSFLTVVAIFLAVLAVSYQDIVATRITGGTRLENKSGQERISSYSRAGEIIKQNPVLGVGVGNYTLALARHQEEPLSWDYQPVHNTFLLILAEIGVVGFLFFVSILVYLAGRSLREGNAANLAILSSLVIMLMVDHWWWSLHFGVLLLGLVLGVVFRNLNNKKSVVNSK